MTQISALGSLTVTVHGSEVPIGGPRQRRLLAFLLVHCNTVVSVDQVAEAVFAGEPTPAAATTLRSYVARMRRVISTDDSTIRLVTKAPGYLLELPIDAFDVLRFERSVTKIRRRLAGEDPHRVTLELRAALADWRGQPYAEFADEEWIRAEAQRLDELRLLAHELLFEAELACGRAAVIVPEIEALVAAYPLREATRAQLMTALYRSGRQAEALGVFDAYRRTLLEELGLDPSPALGELEQQILTHDTSLMQADPAEDFLRGYRLGERLGTGGNGTVYAARIPGLERDMVIRVIRSEVADNPDFVRSFESTARRVASIAHPAIVPMHDYWREPGAAYIVSERMRGGTLTDRLRRGPIPLTEATTLVRRIGGALAASSDAGVARSQVKASDVLYDGRGEPWLSDFAVLAPDLPSPDSDGVRNFAAMVRDCLSNPTEAVGEILTQGCSANGRPPIGVFTQRLLGALEGGAASDAPETLNPYKGLRSFDEADAADFFGRRDLTDEMIRRLDGPTESSRLLMVVGGSGTGKSSVVRAGVLPRLRLGDVAGSQLWFVATIFPGVSPFRELAESLRQVSVSDASCTAEDLALDSWGIDRAIRSMLAEDGQLLLVIDQFEELFTLTSENEQRAFLDGVMHAIHAPDCRLRVIATLRADFYDRPLAVQGFGTEVNKATITIAAMTPAELEAAIVGPAERVGRNVEAPLVAELVAAVSNEPAALPALQFTLYELAERCGPTLTLKEYRELGGLSGAIAARAEALHASLGEVDRVALRQLFERLVTVKSRAEPTRRRTVRDELTRNGADPASDALIDLWSSARLLLLDRDPYTRLPTVELAHESLLRHWPRLREWIETDREVLTVLEQLREAAAAWQDLGRDAGALYRGARLQVALDIVDQREPGLPASDLEFVAASREARDRESREAADRVNHQARANRRLRVQRLALAVVLVIALIGGFLAVGQRRAAEAERRVATSRELAAASGASLGDDPDRSILLALAAVEESRRGGGPALPDSVEALHRAVMGSRLLLSVPDVGGALDWSPDGKVFVTEGPEESGIIDIRDAGTGESLHAFHGHDVDVNGVAFSTDGMMLATAGDDGALRVWDPGTEALVTEFVHEEGGIVWGPSFSADGSRIAASWLDSGLVRVFDVGSGSLISEIEIPEIVSTSLSADGSRVVLGDTSAPRATMVDTDSGTALFVVGGDDLWIQDVAYSPDGRFFATAGGDGNARVWDATDGALVVAIVGHSGRVNAVDWSADSALLATASDDGTARVWDLTDGVARQRVSVAAQDMQNGVASVAFSPDNRRIMTGDWGIVSVKVWDVSELGGSEWANLPSIESNQIPVAFDSEGSLVAGSGTDVSIWDPSTGLRSRRIGRNDREATSPSPGSSPDDHQVVRMAVNRAAPVLATSTGSLPVLLWDTDTGEQIDSIESTSGEAAVIDLDWSSNGMHLAIVLGSDRCWVSIVDRAGQEVGRLDEVGACIRTARFSPDGQRIATTRWPERMGTDTADAVIWDWALGTRLRTIQTSAWNAVFDSTGRFLATTSELDGTNEVWNVVTGESVSTFAGAAPSEDVAFSPDGQTLATAGLDGVVRLWDPSSGAQELMLDAGGASVSALAFSPDGSQLAALDYDGIVRVWALDLDDLTAIAERRLTRAFTDNECRQFLHTEGCT